MHYNFHNIEALYILCNYEAIIVSFSVMMQPYILWTSLP